MGAQATQAALATIAKELQLLNGRVNELLTVLKQKSNGKGK